MQLLCIAILSDTSLGFVKPFKLDLRLTPRTAMSLMPCLFKRKSLKVFFVC